MTYITGTMPADINPAAAFYAILEPAILAAGLTLEDTVVISTKTYKVFRSLAANTTVNTTWWLTVSYTTTGAGSIGIMTQEHFDTGTNLAFRRVDMSSHPSWAVTPTLANLYGPTSYGGAAGTTGQTLDYATSASYTFPVPTGTVNADNRLLSMPTGTTVGYWVSVTGDRIAVLTSPTPGTVLAGGVYAPHPDQTAKFAANVVPIYSIGLTTASSTSTALGWGNTVYLTRAPGVAGSAEDDYAQIRAEKLGVGITPFPDPGTYVESASGRRVELRMSGAYSGIFGWLTGMKVFRNNIANITRGDTITIDGTSHFLATTPQGVETLAIAAV